MKKIWILLYLIILLGCQYQQDEIKKVKVEFRFAETEFTEGLTESLLFGTEEKFYLHPEVVMSNEDIATAYMDTNNDQLIIGLNFTESSALKFEKLTEENIDRRMGILVDDKLMTAPIIRDKISGGRAIITGNFTEEEVLKIVQGIMAK